MALAELIDVKAPVGTTWTEAQEAAMPDLLEEASDLVLGYLHPCEVPIPVPDAVVRVVAAMVSNVLLRPATGVEAAQMMAGPFSISPTPGSTAPGPYLTAAMKQRLRPYRCHNGMVSQELSGEGYLDKSGYTAAE